MRNIILIVLISTALLSLDLGCVSAPGLKKRDKTKKPVLDGGDRDVVQSIEFRGNRKRKSKYKDKDLRKKLGYEVGDYLDPVLVESGREALAEYYRTKGYANVEVALDREGLPEGRVIYIIVRGKKIRIKSVKFEGNKAVKTRHLRKAAKTKTRRWLILPAYYNEEKVAAGAERLRTFYYEKGYLNHRVEVGGQTHITFIIDEGPLYKVRNITLKGNTQFDNETLLEELKLESGQTYYPKHARAHVGRILKLYGEDGYVDADVRQQRLHVPDANVVDVQFEIVEGKQFRIGRIDISGNEQTHDKVIRRALDEYDFAPGELYNAYIAPKQGGGQLEGYVRDATLADQVIIRPVTPADQADDHKDAKVDVKEGLTGMWSPGVQLGSDLGIAGQLIWQQGNFDIQDWPESIEELLLMRAFKGAGQSLTVKLLAGTRYSYYVVRFTEPYFLDKPTSLSVAGSSGERWRESYDEQRTRGDVGFKKRYRNRWRRSLGFRVENVDVGNLERDAPQEIRDVKGDNFLAGVRFGVGKNSTDNKFMPSKGYTFNVGYEQVTGDDTFGILKGSRTDYMTLYEDLAGRKIILATKLLAATMLADAPPFEKFYAGGVGGGYQHDQYSYGMRGFEYRGVSTRGLQTNVANPRRKDPIGSDWIFLANTEATVPLIGESIAVLFFVDSGTIDTGKYRAAAGTGLQIVIPQGLLGQRLPLRFAFATPFMKDDSDETQVFSFYMGGLLF
jgi:outer membrane protein insertion porin family